MRGAGAQEMSLVSPPATNAAEPQTETPLMLTDPIDASELLDFPDHNLDWSEVMSSIDDFVVPDQLPKPMVQHYDTAIAGRAYQERVVYAVKQMKKWPLQFAGGAFCPFINLNMYPNDIPDALQEAMGMCSLYAHRNTRNEQVAFQCLSQGAKKCAEVLFAPEMLPLLSLLPATQAMCLYQTIQLFDGDITMRAEAEARGPLLIQCLRTLRASYKSVEVETHLVMSNEHRSTDTWREWLLNESIRRTLGTGFSIDGLFSFLKNGWDDDSNFTDLSFFAQRALWSASSQFQWRHAASEKAWLPVQFDRWTTDIAPALPNDVDMLGMVMMVLIQGVDYCREWAGGEHAERFDLLPQT